LLISPDFASWVRRVETLPRLRFRPLATWPAVLPGCVARNSTMRFLVSTWRVRAVARRVLARRAVARRPERAGAASSLCAWNSLICSSSQAKTLLEIRALGFERVDHLLNAGQVLLLVRRDPLGRGPRLAVYEYVNARSN